jgi:hypothetical protein
MWKRPGPAPAGRPTPRFAFAVAAAAIAVAVHAAVFGLFDQEAQRHARLASAVGEHVLAACRREPDRARQRACANAALAQAQRSTAVALSSER